MTIRRPLQIVELDVDTCALTYATGACAAVLGTTGERKCFQTYKTCQDQENFTANTLTLRFCKNQNGAPKGQTIFPALQSVSTNPTRITLGATDERLGTLGKRARITVKLKDFAYHDRYTDPYQAERVSGAAQSSGIGYDPATRGTFFGKLRARWPYYYGRTIRIRNGYVGDAIASMPTRAYIITEWEGPDAAGNVTITAQDPLKLADEDLAQCPVANTGQLASDISEGFTGDVDLTPSGVGDDEYAASGRVCIGSEVMSFTRSGDTLTITGRGLDGTDAASHGEDDSVQQCFRVEADKLQDVAQTLLEDYAGVDPSFITIADWDGEIDRWMSSLNLTRTIAKPTAVKDLLGQLMDFGVIIWWDDSAQQIRMKANRPLDYDETPAELSEGTTIIEGSLSSEDLHDQRLTQVWFFHGQISATGGDEDPENYERLFVAQDADAESEFEYDQKRIHKIFSPWLGGDGDDIFARSVSIRLRDRFRDTPQQVGFVADIKDLTALEIANQIELTTRVLQDDTGASLATQMQVTSVEETEPGHRITVTAQTWRLDGRYGFITEDARPVYGSSSAAQIARGTYMVDGTTLEFADGTGPYIIF